METKDLNDIEDIGVSDSRPNHVSNGNQLAMLRRRRLSSIVTSLDHRQRGNENANIEDYLKRLCTAVELNSGSTTRSEVEEYINILNQMEETRRRRIQIQTGACL